VGATIRAVRGGAAQTRDQVLEVARRRLAAGHAPEEVMHYLANALTNKLLHVPTVQIRRAGAGARHELVAACAHGADPARRRRRPPRAGRRGPHPLRLGK
jgi:glutamyl-tRNA reductase